MVGSDLTIEEIRNFLVLDLVGHFSGKTVCPASLCSWILDNWEVKLGYSQVFHVLSLGWICFIIRNPEAKVKILDDKWFWGPFGLILQKWKVDIDPCHELVNVL